MMARPTPLAALAMEAQVGAREFRLSCAPLYEAALRSGDYGLMAETKQLAQTIRVAELQAKRIAGMADGLASCPDGLFEFGHGVAS